MKSILSLPLLTLTFVHYGCGTNAAKKIAAAIDSEGVYEFGTQTTSEAVSAAAAGDSEGSGGFSLSLAGSSSPFKTSSKTCAVQPDGSALVTISSEIDFEKTSGNDKVSRTQKMSGTNTETRLWSHPAGVECLNGERAKLNLKNDAASYSLKVTIDRTRQQSMSQVNTKKNETRSKSRSFSMKGERSVSVVSYSESGSTSVQEKKVSGSMNRSFSYVDKDGQTKSGSFSSATVGDPMVVKVTRSLSSKEVVSREIVSGTRKNTMSDGTSVELNFSNFVMSGSGESCEANSGSVSIKYLDSAGAVSQSLSCSADSGALACTDGSGAAVELEGPSCDPADDK
ncbi:MAG: hypothetical protein RLZZ488_2376 [Pseudomonadota bacterium]